MAFTQAFSTQLTSINKSGVMKTPLVASWKALKKTDLNFFGAVVSGYLVVTGTMLLQFLLTPMYLEYLGQEQFGALMVVMNLINFAAIGITWMSGGFVRITGEQWAVRDLDGIRVTFRTAKIVFTFYAAILVSLFFLTSALVAKESMGVNSLSLWLAALYFALSYEALPERQLFVGINRQATGNYFELVKVAVTGCLIAFSLPFFQNMSVVWIGFIAGVVIQRLAVSLYWRRAISGLRWAHPSKTMIPLVRRLAGQQGIGYVGYGMLLLALQADILLIGYLGGSEAAARYVLLWKIPEAIGLLLSKLPSTIEPKVIELDARRESTALEQLFVLGRRRYIFLVAVVSLFYGFFGRDLAQLWVGEHALTDQWMYTAAACALFLNSAARWPISFAYALIRLAKLFRIALIELTTKVLLTLVLFPTFDIVAPILASITTHLLYAGLAYQGLIKEETSST